MRASSKRVILIGLVAVLLVAIPGVVWLALTHEPTSYRARVELPRDQREAKAKHFVASSLQLRNDICNEQSWEAVFTDQEVNAWLAEDLMTHFADQLPPDVHEPRIAFDLDRVTLYFKLDQGPLRTVIGVVAQVRVPEDNVLALPLEKIRAGVIPVSADRVIDKITDQARGHGLDVQWRRENDLPVAWIRYRPNPGRTDIVLERLHLRNGQIRLSGRSSSLRGAFAIPTLPSRRVLQLNFPRRNRQSPGDRSAPVFRNSTGPTS